MKKMFLSALLLTVLIYGCEKTEIADYEGNFELSVMSFNLRYDEPADGINQWSNRKQACIAMLNEVKPNIFGVQEALHHQVSYLKENLPNYEFVGVGRDDGHSSGEYSAIFYSTSHIELLENGNFWLSETPEIPSRGWDANNIRMVSWAKFKSIESDKTFFVFNTHFDHKGKESQKKSSELLVQKIQELAGNNTPVFISGDFNMLIGNSRLLPITNKFFSAQRFAEKSDNHKSFNAFGKWYFNRNIDFIFYKNAKAPSYKTIVKKYGVPFISDHYPIISHFNFQ